MVSRRGHSLPELLVALAFLGAAVGAIGGAAITASRWSARAVLRQHALLAATGVLDSLGGDPAPGAGQKAEDGLRTRWRTEAGAAGAALVVVVLREDGLPEDVVDPLVELRVPWVPPLPSLPDP